MQHEESSGQQSERNGGDLRPVWKNASTTPALRYHTEGNGSVTVVLDAGLRDGEETWSAIVPQLATFSSVVQLDRSSGAPAREDVRDLEPGAVAQELQALLREIERTGSLILVGWALGALYAQSTATLLADRVSSLVLIDPVPWLALSERDSLEWQRASGDGSPRKAPVADVSHYHSVAGDSSTGLTPTPPQLDIPVTVIFPGRKPDPEDAAGTRLFAMQQEDVRRFSDLREIIAGRSDASIPHERPDTIIDAVHRYMLMQR